MYGPWPVDQYYNRNGHMVDHNLYFDEVRLRLTQFHYVYQGERLSIDQVMSQPPGKSFENNYFGLSTKGLIRMLNFSYMPLFSIL